MILLFPNLDALHLTLSTDIVSREVTQEPAAVTFDEQGRIYVESPTALSKATTKNLDRIGVKGSRRHATDRPAQVTSWVQILPTTREPGTPDFSSQTPVLFELEDGDDLPALVTEMLRLGNDRQALRWFAAPDQADARRVLLRVIGPPYYTLLRALEKSAAGTAGAVRAYLERAPRVWIEVGHTHAFAKQIRVTESQVLLIRPPRDWLFLEDAPFQDVYDATQFTLPAAPVEWSAATAPAKMTVPVRLTAGNAADVPELWVLRDDGVAQLDALVRDADDRVTQRLMFAVAADSKGGRTVVLRTRPSKLPPPVLPLENALGFKPYWKLPNLFLPSGKRLHPTLRRDAVRSLLADDPDQVVWLLPDGTGGFTPESVADGAFRSLEDWVDYVIEAERQPLAAWIDATRFDFDHFACKDTDRPKVGPDKGDEEPRGKDEDDGKQTRAASQPKTATRGKAVPKQAGPADFLPPPAESKPPSEWKLRRDELERQFLAVDGPLDASERRKLWPELAAANAGVKDQTEAAICWLNALWDAEPLPQEWLAEWVRSEAPTSGGAVRAEDIDHRLSGKKDAPSEPRGMVALFLTAASQIPTPGWLVTRLPVIQKYLEAHERSIPVRAVWLAAFRLSQLSGADVLGLARVRDRLLQRLLEEGLSAERDLPFFLRTAGREDSERLRAVRDRANDLHQQVRAWMTESAKVQKNDAIRTNLPFIDLYFAFAFAKLHEVTQARKLIEAARSGLDEPVPVGRQHEVMKLATEVRWYLFKAFVYRIDQVILGKPHSGRLSPELISELEQLAPPVGAGLVNSPLHFAKYAIERVREQSKILEPHEKPVPYGDWQVSDPIRKEVSELTRIKEPHLLADRVRRLYRSGVHNQPLDQLRFMLLHSAIPLAPRVGEAFTIELIRLVPAALTTATPLGTPEPSDTAQYQGELLERSLYLAAHYDHLDLVNALVNSFLAALRGKPEEHRLRLINATTAQLFHTLRKVGLRDEINRFITRLQSEVLHGAGLAEFRTKYHATPLRWSVALQSLLNLAAGWLTFGLTDQAAPILDAARKELFNPASGPLPPVDFTQLARSYIRALGQASSDFALPRLTEFFQRVDREKITNTQTTAQCYSRLHLNLVEDVILALVSDDFALGPAGRRWLDDDEYVVRRRVHADMKRHLNKSGL